MGKFETSKKQIEGMNREQRNIAYMTAVATAKRVKDTDRVKAKQATDVAYLCVLLGNCEAAERFAETNRTRLYRMTYYDFVMREIANA